MVFNLNRAFFGKNGARPAFLPVEKVRGTGKTAAESYCFFAAIWVKMKKQYECRKDCAMKGYVTKLCDVDSIQFPAELLQTHVDTQLIEKEINALSLRYAK